LAECSSSSSKEIVQHAVFRQHLLVQPSANRVAVRWYMCGTIPTSYVLVVAIIIRGSILGLMKDIFSFSSLGLIKVNHISSTRH
jgi:hypothetical protein